MLSCIKCKADLEEGAKFCDSCGAEQPESLFCENCGEKLANGAAFCDACGEACGRAVDGEKQQQEKTPVTYWLCKDCNTVTIKEPLKCAKCGQNYSKKGFYVLDGMDPKKEDMYFIAENYYNFQQKGKQ